MRNQVLLVAAMVCLLGMGLAKAGAQSGKKPPEPPQPPDEMKIGKPKFLPMQVAPTLTRWEYRVESKASLSVLGNDKFTDGLNKLGAAGWELAAIESPTYSYIFRRPAVGQPKPAAKTAPVPAPKEKAETKLDLRILPLKFANAVEMANLIEESLRLNKYPMQIVPDSRTNQLIVNGSVEAQVAVQGLVERLDRPASNEPAQAAPPNVGPPNKKKKAPPPPE